MSENPLQKAIRDNWKQKESKELLEIWQENNRAEWSDMTFDIIRQILEERGIEIPEQDEIEVDMQDDEEADANAENRPHAPTFYQPQQVLFFAEVTSKMAWVILSFTILNGVRLLFNELDFPLWSAALNTFIAMITGIFTFFMMKGIAYGLYILMEFEFNSRGEK
jgi:hypothetical protein